MKKKIKITLISIVVILILILLGLLSARSGKVKTSPAGTVGNTAGNLNNGGLFCETTDKIYFSNPYDNGALYTMNPDGTDVKRLLPAKAKFLCADDHYLYYYQESSSGKAGLGYLRSTFGLYRITLNGKKAACLTQDTIFDMQLVDNHIYYTTTGDNGPEFRKVGIDKSDKKLLANFAFNPSCVVNGLIYFNGTDTNHYLYSWNPQTDSSSVVWEGNIWDPVYDNGYIYYMDVPHDYRLCRYSLAEDRVEILTHDRIDCFNVGGGYIYYQANSAKNPALKKMNLDGSNVETVVEGNYTAINMTSRYVYFQMFGYETPLYRVPLGSTSVSTFDAAQEAAMRYLE